MRSSLSTPSQLVNGLVVRAMVLKAHEAGTVDGRHLRAAVGSLRGESHRIVDALDAVLSGI